MHFHDLITDRKANAGSSGFGTALIEFFLDKRNFVLRDAAAVVTDPDHHKVVLHTHGGVNLLAFAAMGVEDDFVVVRIRDYGCGIPEDEIPLVKKKFYKGSSKARGTGIGLAVCDEIVEMHGGTLTLENAPGGGTLVTIRLPAGEL